MSVLIKHFGAIVSSFKRRLSTLLYFRRIGILRNHTETQGKIELVSKLVWASSVYNT
jgi:hypothetical protein